MSADGAANTAKTLAALSIAGSDSSGGAGIQADLKTFAALGVYGTTAITAITAQNTLGVTAVHLVPGDIVAAQIDAVFADLNVRAVKTGMLGGAEQIGATADRLRRWAGDVPVVVDPVMVSTSGARLLEASAVRALVEGLFPLADIITPNLAEAAALLDVSIARTDGEIDEQARRLYALGPRAVLIKGGHRDDATATDVLFDGTEIHRFTASRVPTRNTHGTGCTLSSAIAAHLATGVPIATAVDAAKAYLQGALLAADAFHIGDGAGPVAHFWKMPQI
ncbi:bifunctional hydroxymethylpyrimidine kinase/phosphomethylpyrimidine kinase [Rhodomicrobium lacus]|uniref:bifunctional hydroxymethylpyrimidine kinase/phosphomethylpyrimidine kinase n=1 Tax=Rhodomicrobium lacus TaxID=2498452 RepID=UPI0026E3B988|nr:bifunctional hydroxymethylpyrimidine kinase/phosphomethylpyrimidine kinase [Rhodomicrobium lacus]WKW50504.1 bifunctional hydroxymethylpyrimidine kinase/phosphomethylpyrimidine kinase [Rhodomicrobium lacus]